MQNTGSTHERDFHAGHVTTPPGRAKPKQRKSARRIFTRRTCATLAALGCSLLAACSTPGPSHAFLFSPALGNTVRDLDPATGAELSAVPAFVKPDETVSGMVYDPFTDHLFLRIFPGRFVRVIDRPDRSIKREFSSLNLAIGGHDFAIRSTDRHFFFSDASGPVLIETNINGDFVRRIALAGLSAPVHGVAYDLVNKELLILAEPLSDRVHRFAPDGTARGQIALATPVRGISLGYDPEARTLYASLADGSAIGAFDRQGRLLRRLPRPAPDQDVFIDLGPRSLLRLF